MKRLIILTCALLLIHQGVSAQRGTGPRRINKKKNSTMHKATKHVQLWESWILNEGFNYSKSPLAAPANITAIGEIDSCTAVDSSKIDQFIDHCTWYVLANQGQSKNYIDVAPLDGGTVGISHFAVGGLEKLYYEIGDAGCQKYWGKTAKELADNYADGCRPAGKKGNDDGWGCYSGGHNPLNIEWRKGMEEFVKDTANNEIQDRATRVGRRKAVEAAMQKGWKSPFELAVAIGVSNSRGNGGFNKIASANGWDAERTLQAYVDSDSGSSGHCQRRADLINKFYPKCTGGLSTDTPKNSIQP